MYAFLFKKCKNCSKHQKKHFMQHRMHLVIVLSHLFSLSSMCSRMKRITLQMVNTKEPNATVPKWYLWKEINGWKSQYDNIKMDLIHRKVRLRPTVSVKYGTSFLWNVQYQVANVAASTISPEADIKLSPQNKPKTLSAWIVREIRSTISEIYQFNDIQWYSVYYPQGPRSMWLLVAPELLWNYMLLFYILLFRSSCCLYKTRWIFSDHILPHPSKNEKRNQLIGS